MTHYRKVLRAKIHRAFVTHADLEYEGSITIPPELMEAADLHPYEAVNVWNVTQGTRFETYAITGEPRSGDIAINGAAAHLASPGDRIIIASFVDIPEHELETFKPKLVFIDQNNADFVLKTETPGPMTPPQIPENKMT
jgi:aspartate 1-decarboxylase